MKSNSTVKWNELDVKSLHQDTPFFLVYNNRIEFTIMYNNAIKFTIMYNNTKLSYSMV